MNIQNIRNNLGVVWMKGRALYGLFCVCLTKQSSDVYFFTEKFLQGTAHPDCKSQLRLPKQNKHIA